MYRIVYTKPGYGTGYCTSAYSRSRGQAEEIPSPHSTIKPNVARRITAITTHQTQWSGCGFRGQSIIGAVGLPASSVLQEGGERARA